MSVTINYISEGSIADEKGLKKGDIIQSINNTPVRDVIDYMFHSHDCIHSLKIKRGDKLKNIKIDNEEGTPLGIELKAFKTKTCRNKCIFCFVSQLPKGMRKTLYLKDDDCRMSFLYGNYVTLTNLSTADRKRIIEQRLGPLYISVHATNNELRRKMLGNPKAPDILDEIHILTAHKIRLHTQIVVCPGLNDGEELKNTIKDLSKYYPYVASIAVVPVGLTKNKKPGVRPVEKEDALKIIEIIKTFRSRLKKRHGDPVVHIADEFYIKAGLPFPALKEYGDLPQIENGVGLVPLFQHQAKKLRMIKKVHSVKAATFTGASFMPFLEEFAERLKTIEGLELDIFRVDNRFFGQSVTVAGLLTGKDILKTILGKTDADCLLVPDVTLREGTEMFLDNVTLKDLAESLGMNVTVIESTPEGLLKGIKDECKRKD